jgi:hypothetical protein
MAHELTHHFVASEPGERPDRRARLLMVEVPVRGEQAVEMDVSATRSTIRRAQPDMMAAACAPATSSRCGAAR